MPNTTSSLDSASSGGAIHYNAVPTPRVSTKTSLIICVAGAAVLIAALVMLH
jgi:hypothetical protein